MSIQVKNLTHIYSPGMPDEQVALEDVSFSVADGEVVGVIGHTGSGKSTMLQHLNGLLKPSSGTIVVGDVDITEKGVAMREIRKRVGLVFQYPEYQLFEETVALDVAFGPKNLGLDEDEIEKRVRAAIKEVGLDYEKIKDRSPFELSGGQKRRVAIAGVIAMMPEVLILDEPTAGLDPGAHEEILKMIERIHENSGNIIIFVSHNMGDVARLSDKVLVMDDGHLILSGTPTEVFSKKDELKAIGLSVPPVTNLMQQLHDRGLDIDPDKLNLDEAEEELVRYLQRTKIND